ncbi:MAG TPA: hypothetical protein VJX94_21360 [Stellaceae bacterium]|nr:hypothetical protein [Stellaceae bacterium]
MAGQQLDLFAADPIGIEPDSRGAQPPLRAAELADAALIAALPDARLATAPSLAAEAGCRRLVAAIPALEGYAGDSSGSAATGWSPSRRRRYRH